MGLNSGRVIAGEIGSGSLGYAVTGEHVGMAQRLESAAPPGAVMLSESTAQLVEHTVTLGEPELVRIKGTDEPVRARRLMAISARDGLIGRAETSLVGRRWEMAAVEAVDELRQAGRLFYGVWGTGLLVETLLDRGADGDLAQAQEAIDWLANLPADGGSAGRDITLLRLRALLARARGENVAYRDLVGRYRAMAESLGYEGHIAWAEAM